MPPAEESVPAARNPVRLRYYMADGSVFLDGTYVT